MHPYNASLYSPALAAGGNTGEIRLRLSEKTLSLRVAFGER